MDAQNLTNESMRLLERSGVPANKLNGAFLEEYALNLLRFLVWDDLGLNLLVIALSVDVPLWEGFAWENGSPVWKTAMWRPDVAIGRYFVDDTQMQLNSTPREMAERRSWTGPFSPLIVVSCKTRVSTAEFYDSRARFEILRRTSPYTLALELANRNAIAEEHLKADPMIGVEYFLEDGPAVLDRFVEEIKKHLRKYA